MTEAAVLYEQRDQGAWITLNRPQALHAELHVFESYTACEDILQA